MITTSKYWLLSFILLAIVCSAAYGQNVSLPDSGRGYFIASKFQTGTILAQNSRLASLVNANPWTFQLDVSVLKNTQRVWEYGKCYSKNGISFSYTDFGNADKLGQAKSVVLYVEPYLSFSRKMQVTFRGGAGLTYLNKVYDAKTDSNNLFYSKPISFMLLVNATVYYVINPHLNVSLSAQFSHISNGGTRWPNYGMNFPTLGIGLEYAIHPQQLKARPSAPFTNRSVKLITHLFGGRNMVRGDETFAEEKRFVGGVNIGLLKPLGRLYAIGVGGEVYYDEITRIKQQRYNLNFNSTIGAVNLQHYFFFGRLLCGQQLEYYVTKLNPDVSSKIYQRYFFEYKVAGQWYLGFSLKAHGQISDYMSISTTYVLF